MIARSPRSRRSEQLRGLELLDTLTKTASACRAVTPEEVAHYREFGWVKLKGFVQPHYLERLMEIAHRRMGEDADSNADYGINIPYFNAEAGDGLADETVREMIGGIGKAGKALLARKDATVEARYFQDFFAPKLPSSRQSKNGGNGPTSFHQDYITFAVDRTGGMTFWIPLEAYTPEAGTMSFISESHKLGGLGNYTNYNGRDIREVYPELSDLEMSEQMVYELGDITVHSHLTVHGAGKNMMDKPRWAYIVLVQPSDACWNGAMPEAFDPTGMVQNQLLPDDRFPIIS